MFLIVTNRSQQIKKKHTHTYVEAKTDLVNLGMTESLSPQYFRCILVPTITTTTQLHNNKKGKGKFSHISFFVSLIHTHTHIQMEEFSDCFYYSCFTFYRKRKKKRIKCERTGGDADDNAGYGGCITIFFLLCISSFQYY